MKRSKNNSKRNGERGVVILLVAVFLLFVVGAMAALAIDLVTFYTARSEAQLAADGAALAAARVMANSGMTSNPTDFALVANVEILARTVATQVAIHNKVGGRFVKGSEITITIQPSPSIVAGSANPQVTVRISRTDLPTFFARIWGRTQVAVSASATAEAYNPSGLNNAVGQAPPVAPVCVKPWALPNLDPRNGTAIFNPATGDIWDTTRALLGYDLTTVPISMSAACTNCTNLVPPAPAAWKYYPGKPTSFPAPTQSLPICSTALTTNYQMTVAGCVQTPISCSSTVDLDNLNYPNRDAETADAVNCLTHSVNGNGDRLDLTGGPNPPFEFIAGDDNPLALPTGTKLLVSDSLVTVPVIDTVNPPLNSGSTTAPVIGFVQLFLNPDGLSAPASGQIQTRVVNIVGCGTNATGQPVQGNGGSAVAVRLVSP